MSVKKYQSHKIVEAIKVDYLDCRFYEGTNDDAESVYREIDLPIPKEWGDIDVFSLFARALPSNDFYLVKYSDNYISWCPAHIFEKDYTVLGE